MGREDDKGQEAFGELVESGNDITAGEGEPPFYKTGKQVSGHAEDTRRGTDPPCKTQGGSCQSACGYSSQETANGLVAPEKRTPIRKFVIEINRRAPLLLKNQGHERRGEIYHPQQNQQFQKKDHLIVLNLCIIVSIHSMRAVGQ